jgi:membrane associated rhomboid family serine protease
MIALFFLGSALETKVKYWQYLIVYFVGGILANLTMLIPVFASPDSIGAGASGAISALIGFGTFFSPGKLVMFPSIIPLPFVVAGALFFLAQSLNLFTPSEIAYSVHLMGMFIGSLFGLIWAEKRGKKIFIFLLTLVAIILLPYVIQMIFNLVF